MEAKKSQKKCQICGEDTNSVCAGCRKVYYCSKEHQKDDWKQHKKICGKSQTENKQDASPSPSTPSSSSLPQPHPSSWAHGLTSPKKYEWLIDVYRMRVDDMYAWCGEIVGLYNPESTKFDVLTHFWVFCKLCARRGVIPAQDWDWGKFLDVAAKNLMYAFEKSDAKEKYGGENVFSVITGGRSLRATGEYVYGTGIGNISFEGVGDDEAQELENKVEKWKDNIDEDDEDLGEYMGSAFWNNDKRFLDVGGKSKWIKLIHQLSEPHGYY